MNMQEVTMSFVNPAHPASSSQMPEPSSIPNYAAPNGGVPHTTAPSSGFKFQDEVLVSQTQEDRMK
jgi:hypothetical protein